MQVGGACVVGVVLEVQMACACIQLEKSSLIHAVDIGNNGSAFVELLVGRSSSPDRYEPLVAMTTFMTPKESRQWGNTNRVKIFGTPSLTPS